MRRTLVALAAVAVVGAACAFIWPTRYRDIPVAASAHHTVYAARENRFTGVAEVLTRNGWVPVRPDTSAPRCVSAPDTVETLAQRIERIRRDCGPLTRR